MRAAKQKADPEDLRQFMEDLEGVGRDHPDTMRANPDLAADLLHLRKKSRERYGKVVGIMKTIRPEKVLTWLQDQILSSLQRSCSHPIEMVATDLLDGDWNDLSIKYCRRCGSVQLVTGKPFASVEHTWRCPDPNLWRG